MSSYLQLVWLNPANKHELLWDYGMCADTSRGAAVRDLITKALKGPLGPAQQEVLSLSLSLNFYELCDKSVLVFDYIEYTSNN